MSYQKILIGNSLDVLKTFDDESIDVCVTSPPYWGLRNYGDNTISNYGDWSGQLGLEPNPMDYIEHLCMIFDEVYRVLKPTGACWVNIGDTYATVSGSGFQNDNVAANKEIASIKNANELRKTLNQYGFKQKSLCQIPSRFAIAMTDRGWILRNECIWHKPNVMPSSIKDRFTIDFEKVFFFVKNKKYFFKQQFEPLQCINVCSKNSPNNYPNGRNCRTVWRISTKGEKYTHVAMFPEDLIKRPIDACCPPNGVVLDPFAGSGTTLSYCKKININAIGIDINSEYEPIMRDRLDREKGINLIKTIDDCE